VVRWGHLLAVGHQLLVQVLAGREAGLDELDVLIRCAKPESLDHLSRQVGDARPGLHGTHDVGVSARSSRLGNVA
jgi:hypothetical protein